MHWARHIEIEDLLEGDLQLIYEHCGEDVLLTLLDRLKGMHLYLKAEPVRDMKRRFIRQRAGDLSAKELAAMLDVSQEFVYDTLREEEKDDSQSAPLFEQQVQDQ